MTAPAGEVSKMPFTLTATKGRMDSETPRDGATEPNCITAYLVWTIGKKTDPY